MNRNAKIALGIIAGLSIIGTLAYINRKKIKKIAKKVITKVWDTITELRISNLHPEIRKDVKNYINEAQTKLGKKLRVTSGFRSHKEQNELYAKGRTKPGKIVTKARGGQSYHNFGLAFDVVEIKNGKALWRNPDWEKIGRLGEKYGFSWGGRWRTFKDKPHFQKTFGKRTKQLQAMYARDKKKGKYVILV